MPAAIIHYASLPYHKLAKGMIKDLPQLAVEKHITHPALIIIGPVTDTELLLETQ
jgi:uroporphyrin-III C-methyltransferase